MTRDETAALARGVIALGFDGDDVASAPLDALRAFAPGALTLFARNVGSTGALAELVAALRAIADPPPLIAVDQEGGRVARIRDGIAQLPPAMALGAADDPSLTERLGVLLGRDLAALGISVDFAPVADLALESAGSVIGSRAFGDDPEHVARHAAAFARGLERGGVAATLKHFPGHGATALDSHVTLPRIAAGAATLRARDLIPFGRAASEASLVMLAHVVAEAFDAVRPASLSSAVIAVLRDELAFSGVVATDCLEMDAISGGAGTAAAAVAALAAGADLLLISHRLDRAHAAVEAIVAAVSDGRLSDARLAEAHARVRRLRERFAYPSPAHDAEVDAAAPVAAARRAVTIVRGDPVLAAGRAVTVISFEGTLADNAALSGMRAGTIEAPSLSSALRKRRWKSEIMRVPLAPDDDDLELLLEHIPRLGEREFVIVTRRADLHPAQQAAVARILALVPGALVVSAREPFDAVLWSHAQRVVCIYGDEPLAFEGCADVLSGFAAAAGTLPVRLENAAVR